MDKKKEKTTEDINHYFSEEKHKLEDSKLLSRMEELQADIKTQFQNVENKIRNIITDRTHQDELNSNLLSELHQIGELLQKLDHAHQYTHRVVTQHEKSLGENRQLIYKIEKELQKIKSVLRVD
jgi:hypothetical protein